MDKEDIKRQVPQILLSHAYSGTEGVAGTVCRSQRDGRVHPAWPVGTSGSLSDAHRLGSRQDSVGWCDSLRREVERYTLIYFPGWDSNDVS